MAPLELDFNKLRELRSIKPLTDLYHETSAGQGPTFAWVHGPSGVGKTFLAQQLEQVDDKLIFVRGKFNEFQAEPYQAIVEVCLNLFEHVDEEVQEKLCPAMKHQSQELISTVRTYDKVRNGMRGFSFTY